MAVNYLQDYLGIDPNDYSAMERGIASVSPVGRSIIPSFDRPRRRPMPIRPIIGRPIRPIMPRPIRPPRLIGGPPPARKLPIIPRLRRAPTPNLSNQVTGLEEQIAKLTEQMSLLETEKQDALQQQDTMRAELAQAQQNALAEQAEQFGGERSALEQQIADLQAQISGMQAPVDTPPIVKDAPISTPPPEDFGFGPGVRRSEDFFDPRDMQPPPMPPKREDFMSIGGPGGGIPDPRADMPMPPRTRPPMPPRQRPRPDPVPAPMPPSMPMGMPMMGGGARGGFGMRGMQPMMMRAGGGGISKAIVDLQNRFK